MAIQKRRRALLEGVEEQESDAGPTDPSTPRAPNHHQPEDVGEPETERITAYATLAQLDHLDLEIRKLRRGMRVHLPRTALIRGLVEGFSRGKVDLVAAGVTDERALADYVAGVLGSREDRCRRGDVDLEEEMEAVTIYLHPDHVDRLDEEIRRIRRAVRKRLPRTALIRGVLEGFRRGEMALVANEASTEEQVAELVASRFQMGSPEGSGEG